MKLKSVRLVRPATKIGYLQMSWMRSNVRDQLWYKLGGQLHFQLEDQLYYEIKKHQTIQTGR